jgi:hypothetical protein
MSVIALSLHRFCCTLRAAARRLASALANTTFAASMTDAGGASRRASAVASYRWAERGRCQSACSCHAAWS